MYNPNNRNNAAIFQTVKYILKLNSTTRAYVTFSERSVIKPLFNVCVPGSNSVLGCCDPVVMGLSKPVPNGTKAIDVYLR